MLCQAPEIPCQGPKIPNYGPTSVTPESGNFIYVEKSTKERYDRIRKFYYCPAFVVHPARRGEYGTVSSLIVGTDHCVVQLVICVVVRKGRPGVSSACGQRLSHAWRLVGVSCGHHMARKPHPSWSWQPRDRVIAHVSVLWACADRSSPTSSLGGVFT